MAFAARRSRARGFSLVELMISLIAGLILVGAVLAFTVSSVRSNAEFVSATRLTQELRNTMDFVSRELRRAGYDQNYLSQLARSTGSTDASDFSPIFYSAVGPCLVYSYDREPGTPGQLDPDNGELRGIRLRQTGGVGVIEVATSDATNTTITCGNAGNTANYATYPASCSGEWCPLTDHRLLNITTFTVTDLSPAVIMGSSSTSVPMRIREFEIEIGGQLVGSADVTRNVRSRVRVRADCLRTGVDATAVETSCTNVPAP
jgi:prepilin peptidase dependent protein B